MSLNSILATAPLTTSGYHIKANGTTLGNSLIWDNGTNVGIGNTNTSYTLDVSGTGRFTGNLLTGGYALIGTTASTGVGASRLQVTGTTAQLLVSNTTSSGHIALYTTGVDAYITKNTASGNMYFGLAPQDGSSFTSQMTITSAGNVGIGTSSPASKLDISGGITLSGNGTQANNTLFTLSNGYMYLDGNTNGLILENNSSSSTRIRLEAADNMQFQTASTERMRITSAGQIYTSNAPAGDWSMRVIGSSVTSSSYGFKVLGGTNSSDDTMLVTNQSGATVYIRIRGDGAFYTGNGSNSPRNSTTGNASNVFIDDTDSGRLYRSTSSIKYKKDVINYTRGLNEVMQLRPVFYKGISDNDGDKQFAGLIAEEIHDLGLTEFVQYAEDGTPDALAYSNMIALLTKAIQELSAQNQDLKSRLDKAGL